MIGCKQFTLGVVAAVCLTFTGVTAQAQMLPGMSWQQQQAWRQWERQNMGGRHFVPHRGESQQAFRNRMLRQCNNRWNVCAARCNTLHQHQRAACTLHCNNLLRQCRRGW